MDNSNNQQQQEENPLTTWYNNFINKTPFVTRMVLQALIFSWILSIFINEEALINIPYFTILHFEIYRLLFASFFTSSILSLVFMIIIYYRMGPQMENAMGSSKSIILLLSLAISVNLLFIIMCFFLNIIGGMDQALFYRAQGFWLVLFAQMQIQCLKTPEQPRRFLCFPVNIPSKYYPIALWLLFGFLSRTDYLLANGCSLLVGWFYSKGYLDFIKVSNEKIQNWENSENNILNTLKQNPGFITSDYALGDEMVPLNNPDDHQAQNQQGGGMFGNMFGGMMQRNNPNQNQENKKEDQGSSYMFREGKTKQKNTSINNNNETSFPGGGQTLGSSSSYSSMTHVDKEEARKARLANFAKKNQSNIDHEYDNAHVLTLLEMGYSREQAKNALQATNGNLEAAISLIMDS